MVTANKLKIFTTSLILSLGSLVIAETALADGSSKAITRLRMQLARPTAKEKYPTPLSTTNLTRTGKKLFDKGAGIELSTTYFINKNFASEISVGVTSYKMKRTLTTNGNPGPYSETYMSQKSLKKKAFVVPVTGLLQYHVMPNKEISPYVGAGYHYSFISAPSKSFAKMGNSSGPVLQGGIDIWDKEDIGFNIDIKKYWGTAKLTSVNLNDVGGNGYQSKVKVDPTVISVGLDWKL